MIYVISFNILAVVYQGNTGVLHWLSYTTGSMCYHCISDMCTPYSIFGLSSYWKTEGKIVALNIILIYVPVLCCQRPYWVGKLTKHLQCSFKENLPWWCMVELGRKFVFLLLLIPFPQNTVSYIAI